MFAAVGKLFLKLLGGSRNERVVRARMALVRERINPACEALEAEYLDLVRRAAREMDGQVDAEALVSAARRLEVVPLAVKEWLSGKTAAFRRRLGEGEPLRAILPEAFAVVRLASWLGRDHRQFDVQLVAGQVLHEGSIAEEATGEGKTIACYPAIYMAALAGKKVHVVTVNDYLVQRDRDFAAPIFELLGLRVGAIQQQMEPHERQPQYACDVIYGTNSEFGFDYLRDNMKLRVEDQVQGPQDFAIIDEVDSILIDEARTPLIISGPAYGDVNRYRKADAVARELIKRHRAYDQAERRVEAARRTVKALEGELSKASDQNRSATAKKLEKARAELEQAEAALQRHTKYYEVELDKKSVHLTHEGVTAAQEVAGLGSFYQGANMEWPHLIDQAMRAHVVYQRDKDYVVRDGEVVIVDEFTGRLMEGRQWSDGLHQAVEAKEGVTIKEENQTMATITLQNLFKLYAKLSGMTGTAMTEAEEFMKIYSLDVISVPTHRPVNRVDHEDRIYGTVEEKYDALVEEIHEYAYKLRRPVLVGTTSIEKSDRLSEMLTHRYGIAHEVLNARPENAAREAEIVALAGRQHPIKPGSKRMVGNVTIATNMAGRGTDIKLAPSVVCETCKVPPPERLAELGVEAQDLFPPGTTKCCIHCPEYDPRTGCAHCFKPKIDPDFPARGRTQCREVVPCGLHIVGTERHEARRIDNQLRGRSGRQGDPGSSRFFLSLRDDLMAIFAGEWTLKVLGWLGLQKGQAIEDKRVTRGIARAQKKVEQRNFDIRKNLLEYDEVMDHQRRGFYGVRQRVLEGRDIPQTVREMIRASIRDAVANYLAEDYPRRCIAEWARQNLEVNVSPDRIRGQTPEEMPLIEEDLRRAAKEEAAATISMTIGEYADPSLEPREWDLRGLSSWAMSRFNVNLSQNQLRRMSPQEMEQAVIQAAMERIDRIDFTPIQRYLRPGFGAGALADWAAGKFGVELAPGELPAEEPDRAEENIWRAVESECRRREIEYPVEHALDVTIAQFWPENTAGAGALCQWVNRRYGAGWTTEALKDKSLEQIHQELVDLSERFLTGGGVEQAVSEALAGLGDGRSGGEQDVSPPADQAGLPEVLVAVGRELLQRSGGAAEQFAGLDAQAAAEVFERTRRRFDFLLSESDLRQGDLGEVLARVGRAYLRQELTQLERSVLLQFYDLSWKDHLLAMDHLRGGIGFRGYAEQDPKTVYKKEGYRLFEEMLASVREKVTDVILKTRLGREAEMESVYQVSQLLHEQLLGYDHLAQEAAAMQAAAEAQKVRTIVREHPKVGRNDPCPCGSGKKYKKCHGRNL